MTTSLTPYDALYIIRNSRYYDLTGALAYLESDDGFGLPGVTRITERGPLQNGVSDLGFRLQPRNVNLVLVKPEACPNTWRALRQRFLEAFKPSDLPLNMRWEFGDGSRRQIDMHFTGGLSLPWTVADRVRPSLRDVVQLYAPDPTWYDPTENSVTWTLALQDELSFPIEFPISFGSDAISESVEVTYPGTWLAFPIVTFTGPIVAPRIQNITTGEKLELSYTVSAGESVIIDTREGYKTVTNNSGVNLISYLSSDSDLATFHIAADPEAEDGVNILFAAGTEAIFGQTSIRAEWNDRYIGI